MITEELLEFIRNQYAAGMSVDEMKNLLIAEGGWEAHDIDEALQAISEMQSEESASDILSPSEIVKEGEEGDMSGTPALDTVAEKESSIEAVAPSAEGNGTDSSHPMHDTSPADDFLGIFSAHQPTKEEVTFSSPSSVSLPSEPHVPPAQELPPVKEPELPPPPPVTVAPPVTLTPPPVIHEQSSPATPLVPPPPSSLEIPVTFTSRAPLSKEPEVLVAVTPPEIAVPPPPLVATPPQPVIVTAPVTPAPQHPVAPPPQPAVPKTTPPVLPSVKTEGVKASAPEKSPTVTFDLSMLRKNTADAQGTPANGAQIDAGKVVETKSVAELWLQGARKQADVSKSTTSGGGLSGVPVRPKILSRRTMSSDILLRGVGEAIPGIPALAVPEEKPKLHPQIETASGFKATEVPAPSIKNVPPEIASVPKTPVPETTSSGKFVSRAVVSALVSLTVLVVLLLGGWYLFAKMRGPDLAVIYGNAFQQFFSATSFGYHGTAKTNLVLSAATDGVDRSGTIEFDFDYAGLLTNSTQGFGDGLHHIKFKGGLHSGNFQWVTDLESDVRMIGTALYFHVLSFPETSNADPDLFRTYWVKFDFADIAKELALPGVGGEGYRGFGGGSKDMVFSALVERNAPFRTGARLPDEILPSGPAYHIALDPNPDQMIALAGLLYQKYMNADLTLDENQKLRLKDALAKLKGDILIDQKTNALLKLSIRGDLDDDIIGVHVKGPLAFTFDFSDTNKPVEVAAPTPMLTLEELRTRMDDYKKVKERRMRDSVKQSGSKDIETALLSYRAEKGRYPTFLVDLIAAKKLSTSTMSEITLKTYFYAAYVKPDVLTKSGLCTTRGKICTYYHLGVNFDDMTNPLLGNDADQNTELRGADTAGCGGEQDVACYDVVSTPVEIPIVPASTTPTSTTTKSLNP